MDAPPQAIGKQHNYPGRCVNGCQKPSRRIDHQGAKQHIERINKYRTNINCHGKHQVHHRQENRYTQPPVEYPLIKPFGHSVFNGHHLHGAADDGFCPLITLDDFVTNKFAIGEHFDFPVRSVGGKQLNHQIIEPLLLRRDDWGNRRAKMISERLGINGDAFPFGNIKHVNRDNHRKTQLKQLLCQDEVSLEVTSVNNVQDDVKITRRQIVPSDLFIQPKVILFE